MILISTEFLLVSRFAAQFEVRARRPRKYYRNEPCNLSMGFIICFSAEKSMATN